MEYLSQKRTDGLDGTDIDNWNYDDLIKLVDEFTQLYNMTETMKCAIIKEGSESTGFLSSSYFYYIETTQASLACSQPTPDAPPQTHWSVKRTQNEFEWLREKIMFHHPMTYIPPAATKSDWLPFLQNFLNKLLLKDSIQEFQPLQDFLKMENYDAFLKKWDGCEPKRKSGYINSF